MGLVSFQKQGKSLVRIILGIQLLVLVYFLVEVFHVQAFASSRVAAARSLQAAGDQTYLPHVSFS